MQTIQSNSKNDDDVKHGSIFFLTKHKANGEIVTWISQTTDFVIFLCGHNWKDNMRQTDKHSK